MLAEVTPQALQILAKLAPQEYRDMFAVDHVRNPRPETRAVVGSLFRPTNAPSNWQERYVRGLGKFVREHMPRGFEGFKLVIYLDPELEEFVVPWYQDVEFRVMKQPSEDHSPGAAWRLLALSDTSLEVAVLSDLDEMQPILPLLKDAMLQSDRTGVIRLFRGRQDTERRGLHLPYVPLWAGETVARPSVMALMGDMEELLPGFLLFCKLAGQPGCEYGFDERFLAHVVYWYAVQTNVMRTAIEPALLTKISDAALHDLSLSMNAIPVVSE